MFTLNRHLRWKDWLGAATSRNAGSSAEFVRKQNCAADVLAILQNVYPFCIPTSRTSKNGSNFHTRARAVHLDAIRVLFIHQLMHQ